MPRLKLGAPLGIPLRANEMTDLATVADVEKVLLRSITDAAEVAAVEFHLAGASNAIRDYVSQYIERVADDAIVLNGPLNSTKILLPELPVISVASVEEDGVLLVADEDYKLDPDKGILHRLDGYVWSQGVQNIEITYTHGHAPIPDTIIEICARIASRLFQAGLKSQESAGVPGVSSKSLGDFSVSYAVESGEGTMGASSARMLLFSEKDLLDKYLAK